APYKLEVKMSSLPSKTQITEALKTASSALAEVETVKKELHRIEKSVATKGSLKAHHIGDPTSKLAMNKVAALPMDKIEKELETALKKIAPFKPEVLEHMKHPTFDIWAWSDNELLLLLQVMMESLGLVEAFSIDTTKLRRFLLAVKYAYNENPFHNFRHCFCVTQMMYAIIHVTGIHNRMAPMEKLSLI
ncbi:High affinity cAMP-specific and IBMX-insensitive 3',5'-cyclic phosphodiesterase 9A, partial [Cladochytrium tenue]